MMNNATLHPQQNLYSLGASTDSLATSRKFSLGFAIFEPTRRISNAASSLAFKIRNAVKPTDNASDKALSDIQEITKFITENEELWDDFRTKLVESNIITNTAVTFFLLRYISERRRDLEVMLEESKKKKEKPKQQSKGVKFIRHIRNSTESLTNMASKGIKKMQKRTSKNTPKRTSFDLVRRNCASAEEQMQNSAPTLTTSADLNLQSSCQKSPAYPEEDVDKEASNSLPSTVSPGFQSTKRMSFNFIRRDQSNSNDATTRNSMVRQQVTPTDERLSAPKRYAELPRKISLDFDASSHDVTSRKTYAEFRNYSVSASCQENQSNPRGNEQWNIQPVASGTLHSRISSSTNFSLRKQSNVLQTPSKTYRPESTFGTKNNNSCVRMPTVNEKRISGVRPQGVFDLKGRKSLSKSFGVRDIGYDKGVAELKTYSNGNGTHYPKVTKVKTLKDTASLTSPFNTSMESYR